MKYTDARKLGAMALFGEKYGDIVRVVSVGCTGDAHHTEGEAQVEHEHHFCSRELCGGTHTMRTGEIGYFCITSESSVSAGLRRVEALTGRGAEEWIEQQRQVTRALLTQLAVPLPQLTEKIEALQTEIKARNAELAAMRAQLAEGQLDQLLAQVKTAGQISYIAEPVEVTSVEELRHLEEQAQRRLKSGIVVLGAVINERPHIAVAVTPDLIKQGYHAGKLAKKLAETIGGGGGGRPDVAQAGGRDPQSLETALAQVNELLKTPVK
jgi:alanyl-tRNA synthetase